MRNFSAFKWESMLCNFQGINWNFNASFWDYLNIGSLPVWNVWNPWNFSSAFQTAETQDSLLLQQTFSFHRFWILAWGLELWFCCTVLLLCAPSTFSKSKASKQMFCSMWCAAERLSSVAEVLHLGCSTLLCNDSCLQKNTFFIHVILSLYIFILKFWDSGWKDLFFVSIYCIFLHWGFTFAVLALAKSLFTGQGVWKSKDVWVWTVWTVWTTTCNLVTFSMLQPPGLEVNSSTLRGSVLAGSCAQNATIPVLAIPKKGESWDRRKAFVMHTKAFNDGHSLAYMQHRSFSDQEWGCLLALGCVGSRFLTVLVFSPTCMWTTQLLWSSKVQRFQAPLSRVRWPQRDGPRLVLVFFGAT